MCVGEQGLLLASGPLNLNQQALGVGAARESLWGGGFYGSSQALSPAYTTAAVSENDIASGIALWHCLLSQERPREGQ